MSSDEDKPSRPGWKDDRVAITMHVECSTCGIRKPPEDYLEIESRYDAADVTPEVCDHCRKFGPPMADPLRGLDAKQRRAMKSLAAGGSLTEASRASGIDRKTLRESLRGEGRGTMQAAFSRLMVDEGLDSTSILTVFKEAIRANKHQWNSDAKEFEAFPDHGVRLNTAKHVTKLHALEPEREGASAGVKGGIQVNVQTNLGSDEPIEAPGTYRVSVGTVSDGD